MAIALPNCSFSQTTEKPEKLVKQFIKDLFNDSISPKTVVNTYLEIENDTNNSLSISERKEMAIGIVEQTRNGKNKDLGWLIPNYEIKNIKHPKIYPYNKYKHLRTFDISGMESIENRVYVLLDSKKEKILQYFLLNEKGDKIMSFSLFGKGDDAFWFFGF